MHLCVKVSWIMFGMVQFVRTWTWMKAALSIDIPKSIQESGYVRIEMGISTGNQWLLGIPIDYPMATQWDINGIQWVICKILKPEVITHWFRLWTLRDAFWQWQKWGEGVSQKAQHVRHPGGISAASMLGCRSPNNHVYLTRKESKSNWFYRNNLSWTI